MSWAFDLVTFAVVSALATMIFYFLKNKENRPVLAGWMAQGDLGHLYRSALTGILSAVERFYGPRGSWRAFERSLLIAFLYPSAFLILGWVFGGSGEMGDLQILPDWDVWKRSFLFIGIFLYISINFWLIRSYIYNRKKYYWVLIWVVSLGFALALSLTFAGALAFAGAFAGALAGALALALAFAGARARAGAFAGAAAAAFAGGWFFTKPTSPEIIFFFFFLTVLPIANALLDWASWWASRFFLAKLTRKEATWRIVVFDGLLDAVLAIGFLSLLVVGLPVLLQSVNHLLDAVAMPPVDWSTQLRDAHEDPWGKGIMVTLMLVTTLIPTMLHVVALLFAGLGWVLWRAQAWIAKRPDEVTEIEAGLETGLILFALGGAVFSALMLFDFVLWVGGFGEWVNDLLYRIAMTVVEWIGGPGAPVELLGA